MRRTVYSYFVFFIMTTLLVSGHSAVIEQQDTVMGQSHENNPSAGHIDEHLAKMTQNRLFRVEIRPPEKGFRVGLNEMKLSIQRPGGGGFIGAAVIIKPWMPGMGHGVTVEPVVEEEGGGVYRAEQVGFSMPGHWQLIVTVRKGDKTDTVVFEFASIPGKTMPH